MTPASLLEIPSGVVDERFEIVEEIGRGGRGVVYLVRDLARGGGLKALKLLHDGQAADGATIADEFRAAASVRHPAVVRVEEYGRCAGRAYFTMEYVRGADLAAWRGRAGSEQIQRWIHAAAEALEHLRLQGLVHGDLKPANMRVPEDRPGALKILDFGLARADREQATGGTPGYLAPEVLRGAPADTRSDLYSFGVVLWELLAGRPAFASDDPAELMRVTLEEGLAALPAGVPRRLRAAVEKLTARDPKDRFQRPADLLRALAGPRPRLLAEGDLVGRETEQKLLAEWVGSALRHEGGVVVVEGEARVGLSRLLREVRERAQLAGVRVVEAVVAADEPLSPMGGLATRLARPCGGRGPAHDETKAARRHLLDTVSAGLAALVHEQPTMLLCDDLDRAESEARELVAQAAPGWARLGLVVILAGATGGTAPLAAIEGVTRVRLRRLSEDETVLLVASRLGTTPAASRTLGRRVHAESSGLPGLAVAALEAFAEAALCTWGPTGLEVDEQALAEFVLPPLEAVATARRLGRLSPQALTLARSGALLGRRFDPTLVSPLVARKTRQELVTAEVARADASGAGELVFHSEEMRRAALVGLGQDEAHLVSLRASALLLARAAMGQTVDVELLGRALRTAGRGALAHRYLVEAAVRAQAAGDPRRAAQLAAEAAALPAGAVGRARAWLVAAEARRTLVDPEASYAALTAARRLLNPATRGHAPLLVTVLLKQAELAASRSENDRAARAARSALRLARSRRDELGAARARSVLGRVAAQRGEYDRAAAMLRAARRVYARLHAPADEARALNGLGSVAYFRGAHAEALGHYRAAVARFETAGDRLGARSALYNIGMIRTLNLRDVVEAKQALEHALALNREVDDRPRTALCLSVLGGLALQAGRLDEAERHLEQSLAIKAELQDPAGQLLDFVALGELKLMRGLLAEAGTAFERALEVSRHLNDRWHVTFALIGLARLALERAELERAEALARNAVELASEATAKAQEAEALGTLAEALAAQGRHAEALAALARAAEASDRGDDRLQGVLLRARGASLARAGEPEAAAQALRASLDSFDRAGLEYEASRVALELGKQLAEAGRHEEALGCYDRSRTCFERLGAKAALARTLVARAQLKMNLRTR